MELTICHSDIKSSLCQRCAACCRIQIQVAKTDSRYRKFLRTIGYTVIPAVAEGKTDCCDETHDITLDMGYCRHLAYWVEDGEAKYRCKLYGTSEFPQLCGDFDCVSWARSGNGYNEANATLVTAQRALDKLRAASAISINEKTATAVASVDAREGKTE